jgi:LPXTG-motif cell wall-anchored protein
VTPALPRTGTDAAALVLTATGLLLMGAAAVFTARARTSRSRVI